MSLVFWNSVVMYLRIIPFTSLWLPFNMKTCASIQLWEIFICDNSIPPLSYLFLGLWPVEYRTYWMLIDLLCFQSFAVIFNLLSYNLFGLHSGKFPLLLIASCFYSLFWQSYFLFKRVLLCSFSFPKQSLLVLWIQYMPDYKFKDYVSSISWVSSVLEETFFLFFNFFLFLIFSLCLSFMPLVFFLCIVALHCSYVKGWISFLPGSRCGFTFVVIMYRYLCPLGLSHEKEAQLNMWQRWARRVSVFRLRALKS